MDLRPAPHELFDPKSRVMFVFAHQDDELAYAGLIQRMPPSARFVWLTNGDGLAFETGTPRPVYAATRQAETVAAMRLCGVGPERLRFLGYSEHDIYHRFLDVGRRGASAHDVQAFFRDMAAHVSAEVRAFRPDVLVVLAWQGGHPEHDLAHVMAVRALADRPGVPVLELPEYELFNTVPLRFPPWKRGPVHEIRLTPAEMEVKRRVADSYPSQGRIVAQFRTLLGVLGALSALRLKPFTADDYLAREEFGPVPRGRDYTRSPHGLDLLDYIREDCDGVPIRYDAMIGAIVRGLD